MKKILKIVGIIVGLFILGFAILVAYIYFTHKEAYNTDNKPYKNRIGYIDQNKALLNKRYKLCGDGFIQRTYNGSGLDGYALNKKHFRDLAYAEFNSNPYTDSGYLNFRFLVNCEGNAGWFEIIEMNLDLEEQKLNPNLVEELLQFTSQSKHWNILTYTKTGEAYNYYNYVSYRLENGKITEIIP